MSLSFADGRKPSSVRTTARLLAELAGFAALLFLTRFVARGHLVVQMDQECHIGGIAVDILTHGVRFPLLVYAPNEYDNGSFFSGVLAALSFSLLGRNVLALKLVTHVISAAGAVAMLWLLRACLEELGLTSRSVRFAATTALVIAIALAPREFTLFSMYAVGNHAEGSAIDVILLALFSRRLHTRSAARTAALWAVVGLALYLNKGTVLVLPVLAAAEVVLAWRSPRRLAAAAGGFLIGLAPELLTIARQHAAGRDLMGWMTMASKADRNAQVFPRAFLNTICFLGEYRIGLLGVWAAALGSGLALFVRSLRQARRAGWSGAAQPFPHAVPIILGIVLAVSCAHLTELAVMAKNGLDAYVIYGYPPIVVLYALLVARVYAYAIEHWGRTAGRWAAGAAIAMTLVLYRPDATTWGFAKVSALWRNEVGAACSWRFAEGFEREQDYGLAPPGYTREQHALARCRSLSDDLQRVDCVGGIARELSWRQKGHVTGEPPADLSEPERRAYAYEYGTHRKGDTSACRDFESAELAGLCEAAVQTECLVLGDIYTRIVSPPGLGRPRCTVREPPMNGFWAAMRMDLLRRTGADGPNLERAWGDDNLDRCQPVYDLCYGPAPSTH